MAISPVASAPMAYQPPQKRLQPAPSAMPVAQPPAFYNAPVQSVPYGYPPQEPKGPLVCAALACAGLATFFLLPLLVMGKRLAKPSPVFKHWEPFRGVSMTSFSSSGFKRAGDKIQPVPLPSSPDGLSKFRREAQRKIRTLLELQGDTRSQFSSRRIKQELGWSRHLDVGKIRSGLKKQQHRERAEVAAEFQHLFSRKDLEKLLDTKLPKTLPRRYA